MRGQHRYFQCDDPELHHVARRQASRNRVKWEGFGSVIREGNKRCAGMKPSGAGREWRRQPWDPEYTPARDVSPIRACLNKFHLSDRARVSLRVLWDMDEDGRMSALLDGGFLTDTCLRSAGEDLECRGVLRLWHRTSDSQTERKLMCSGVPQKQRHRFHWLHGSVFQGFKIIIHASDITFSACTGDSNVWLRRPSMSFDSPCHISSSK